MTKQKKLMSFMFGSFPLDQQKKPFMDQYPNPFGHLNYRNP